MIYVFISKVALINRHFSTKELALLNNMFWIERPGTAQLASLLAWEQKSFSLGDRVALYLLL